MKVEIHGNMVMHQLANRDAPDKTVIVSHIYASEPEASTVPNAAAWLVKAAMLGPEGVTGQFFSGDNALEIGSSSR